VEHSVVEMGLFHSKERNPLFDDGTGKNPIAAQSGNVWFLVGIWKENPPGTITLNVPEGTTD
jgi:hypothetical protein